MFFKCVNVCLVETTNRLIPYWNHFTTLLESIILHSVQELIEEVFESFEVQDLKSRKVV